MRRTVVTNRFTDHTRRVAKAITGDPICSNESLILELVLQGLTNAQIAQTTHTTEQTIKNVVALMFHKHNVHNRVQLVVKILTQRHKEELRAARKAAEAKPRTDFVPYYPNRFDGPTPPQEELI
jgi:DNA-binding CsgD family transcriptional regulator